MRIIHELNTDRYFFSVIDAARTFLIKQSTLSGALKRNGKTSGYVFAYVDGVPPKPVERYTGTCWEFRKKPSGRNESLVVELDDNMFDRLKKIPDLKYKLEDFIYMQSNALI
jgi:hypothetical protein